MRQSVDKDLVRQHFSRHAVTYDAVTPVQNDMARQLLDVARVRLNCDRVAEILELGCGTGYVTARLPALFPNAAVTAVDISATMVQQAQAQLGDAQQRVRFVVDDAEKMAVGLSRTAPVYDVVISNATVQWFSNPIETLTAYRRCLRADGWLLISTFGPETFAELRDAFVQAEAELGCCRRDYVMPMMSVRHWNAAFSEPPAEAAVVRHDVQRQTYADVRHFLRAVQRAGAANALRGHRRRHISRRLYSTMIRCYQRQHGIQGTSAVSATYETLYIAVGPNTIIS